MKTTRIIILYLITLLTALLLAQYTHADNTLTEAEKLDRISIKYVTCAAYYMIISEKAAIDKQNAFADESRQKSEKALQNAGIFAQTNRTQEEVENIIRQRYQQAITKMITDIGADFSNITSINNNHKMKCQAHMAKPQV